MTIGKLVRHFARCWLSTKDERFVAQVLEAALGRNALYFIEKTQAYAEKWKEGCEVVPADALDGFVATGDPEEDCLIAHAGLVWTHMNGRPWPDEVYHRWLDSLLAANSAEAAYLAASLWPARDLMAKVAYRPVGWRIAEGNLDAETECLVLIEMLKGDDWPRPLYEYDEVTRPSRLPNEYIKKHGFSHPICGLIDLVEAMRDGEVIREIQAALASTQWPEGMRQAAAVLYMLLGSVEAHCWWLPWDLAVILNKLKELSGQIFSEEQNKIINFYFGKSEKIEYEILKKYINYMIVIDNYINKHYNLNQFKELAELIKFKKYILNGLRLSDLFFINKRFVILINRLKSKENKIVERWLEGQGDDPRVNDILTALCIYNQEFDNYGEEAIKNNIKNIYKVNEDINLVKIAINILNKYLISFYDEQKLFSLILNTTKNIKKNINPLFIEDLRNIIILRSSKMSQIRFKKMLTYLKYDLAKNLSNNIYLNHIGLYIYYKILGKWRKNLDIVEYIKNRKYIIMYNYLEEDVLINFNIDKYNNKIKLTKFYLEKIRNNNFKNEREKEVELKKIFKFIDENFLEIFNYIGEYIRNDRNLNIIRKEILSNMHLLNKNSTKKYFIDLLEIENGSFQSIFY